MSVDRLPSIFHTAVAQAVTGLPFSPGDVDMYVSQDQEALLALIAYLKEHFPDSNFHELQQYFNPFKTCRESDFSCPSVFQLENGCGHY